MKFATKVIICCTIFLKLAWCDTCSSNQYKNHPNLLAFLRGFLYTTHTSTTTNNCELLHFESDPCEDLVIGLATDSTQCCKTLNTTKTLQQDPDHSDNSYFEYDVNITSETCQTTSIVSGQVKVLRKYSGEEGYCLTLWICRDSREGVQTYCTKPKPSTMQERLIEQEYKKLGLTYTKVTQNCHYENSKCFH